MRLLADFESRRGCYLGMIWALEAGVSPRSSKLILSSKRGCYLGMRGRGLSTRLPADSEDQERLLPGHERPWPLYEAAS
jgi:hypothetical protein